MPRQSPHPLHKRKKKNHKKSGTGICSPLSRRRPLSLKAQKTDGRPPVSTWLWPCSPVAGTEPSAKQEPSFRFEKRFPNVQGATPTEFPVHGRQKVTSVPQVHTSLNKLSPPMVTGSGLPELVSLPLDLAPCRAVEGAEEQKPGKAFRSNRCCHTTCFFLS